MRQILAFKLNNGTKMHVIADTNSKASAKSQAVSYSNMIFEQKKYRINDKNELVSYEKWGKDKKEIYREGNKSYSIAAVINGSPYMVNVNAQGVKSAYINFKKLYVVEDDVFCFIYEIGQKEKKVSALAVSNRTLKSRDKANKLLDNAIKYLGRIPEIGVYAEDFPLLISMIRDYVNGDYRDIPFNTVLYSLAAIVYFCCPVDLIPDFLPVIGKLDDLGILAYVMTAVHNDLQNYKKFKTEVKAY